MAEPMSIEVVSADRVVWSGEGTSIITRTVEGDVGILAGHSPMLSVLVPSGVEIYTVDNKREVVAVDGGFISVEHGRVAILSEYARMAQEISLDEAEKELAEATARIEEGADDPETLAHYQRANAQVRAASKAS